MKDVATDSCPGAPEQPNEWPQCSKKENVKCGKACGCHNASTPQEKSRIPRTLGENSFVTSFFARILFELVHVVPRRRGPIAMPSKKPTPAKINRIHFKYSL